MRRRMEAIGIDVDATTRGVKRAVVLFVVAGVIFGATFIWLGGATGVAEILDGVYERVELALGSRDQAEPVIEPATIEEPTSTALVPTASAEETPAVDSSETTAVVEPDPAAPVPTAVPASLPAEAQSRMYREQLQSQQSLGNLAAGEIASARMGTTSVSGDTASVPLTVTYRDGGSISGTMSLRRYSGLWYFYSLYSSGADDSAKPQNVDSSVVSVITSAQGEAGTQQLLANGVVANGFQTVRVDGVSVGSGTATVNVTLLGGTMDRRAARFVMISKVDSGHKLWFLTRFELK
ncbi:MAG: hypothetical protein PF636_03035 [Actinomycetota bacterium]|jgi:hypothetical protein|nr:hypothetical protein [Actinomycetota bacterium]